MSQPNNMAARLARIEARLDEITPQRIDISRVLQAAREAAYARDDRGEAPPPWPVLDPDDPTLVSWDSQELRRGLIAARERADRFDRETAAKLAAQSKAQAETNETDRRFKHLLGSIVDGAATPRDGDDEVQHD